MDDYDCIDDNSKQQEKLSHERNLFRVLYLTKRFMMGYRPTYPRTNERTNGGQRKHVQRIDGDYCIYSILIDIIYYKRDGLLVCVCRVVAMSECPSGHNVLLSIWEEKRRYSSVKIEYADTTR